MDIATAQRYNPQDGCQLSPDCTYTDCHRRRASARGTFAAVAGVAVVAAVAVVVAVVVADGLEIVQLPYGSVV